MQPFFLVEPTYVLTLFDRIFDLGTLYSVGKLTLRRQKIENSKLPDVWGILFSVSHFSLNNRSEEKPYYRSKVQILLYGLIMADFLGTSPTLRTTSRKIAYSKVDNTNQTDSRHKAQDSR